jgi:translation initiation factor IF-1
MAKTGILERDGEIVETLVAGKFRVKLKDTDIIITCYGAGKMKQAHIKIIVGDRVKVEVNQYDMTQGRIVYRYNPAKIAAIAAEERMKAKIKEDSSLSKEKETPPPSKEKEKAA